MSTEKLSSEVAEQLDLSMIRYSRVLEDHRVLSEALAIVPEQDTVLSITSAGDNVLNLLLERPKKIIAFDMSPAQTAILELKITAIQTLDYHEYLVLLGETDNTGDERESVFRKIKTDLPANAQIFWVEKVEAIREGLATSSRLQKYISKNFYVPLSEDIGNKTLDKWFAAQTLEEQKEIFQSVPLDKLEAILRRLFNKERMKQGRSAAQQKYMDKEKSDKDVGDAALEGFIRVGRDVSIMDNFYHSWLCRGRRGFDPQTHPEYAPPFLREEGFQALKGLVDRIEVHTTTLESYLSLKDRLQIDKANLSNIFEYMSVEDAEHLFSVLSDNLAPGGRIAYWILWIQRRPQKCPKLRQLSDLSEELHRKDRVFYYTDFCVLEKADH